MYCSLRCSTVMGWRYHKAEHAAEALDRATRGVMSERVNLKREVEELRRERDTLTERVDQQGREIEILKGQAATSDERIMELTLVVRDLTRTLRRLEREANEGEGWRRE